jgi:hypothetical protein
MRTVATGSTKWTTQDTNATRDAKEEAAAHSATHIQHNARVNSVHSVRGSSSGAAAAHCASRPTLPYATMERASTPRGIVQRMIVRTSNFDGFSLSVSAFLSPAAALLGSTTPARDSPATSPSSPSPSLEKTRSTPVDVTAMRRRSWIGSPGAAGRAPIHAWSTMFICAARQGYQH